MVADMDHHDRQRFEAFRAAFDQLPFNQLPVDIASEDALRLQQWVKANLRCARQSTLPDLAHLAGEALGAPVRQGTLLVVLTASGFDPATGSASETRHEQSTRVTT